jgi:TBC1 domain family member 15
MLIKVLDKELFEKLPANLFCSFRWLLVMFRREFSFEDTIKLWDQLLASVYSLDWILFVAFGMFQMYRDELLKKNLYSNADELLQFFQGKSQKINIDALLLVTEDYYWRFERLARARGHGFPSIRELSLANLLYQLDSCPY